MKVYIITSGEYSDYHIDTVAATMEDALSRLGKIAAEAWGDPYITEWDTDTGEPVTGSSEHRYDVHWDPANGAQLFPDVIESTYNRTHIHHYWYDACFEVNGILARDETHAIKIAAEIKAQFEAEREGLI